MKIKMNLILRYCWFIVFFIKTYLTNNSPSSLQNFDSNSSPQKTSNEKYLVYECKYHCGGWADRLKGIMSVYTLSLLTNRSFLIDMRTPCNFTRLFMPNTIDWRVKEENIININKRLYKDCLNNFKAECLTENDFDALTNTSSSKPIFVIKTNQDWLSHFSTMPHFQAQILKLGFNSSEELKLHLVFHQFYQRLFKLTPSLEEKYLRVKGDAHLTENTQIYCAQIRIGGARWPHVKYDLKINTLGKTQTLFWSFMRENFITHTKNNDWRVFVTSDVESVEQEAIKEFGNDRVIRIPGLNTHVDRETNLGNDCTRIEKPILDFHFLQMCNKAVISGSGFGRLGIWNRAEPLKDVFVFNGENFVTLHDELNGVTKKLQSQTQTQTKSDKYIWAQILPFKKLRK
jgi:hypothetical protein